MPQYNLKNNQSPEINYSQGLLPQRNQAGFWYSDTSCRSNLKQSFQLNSENRRILSKTQHFTYQKISLNEFKLTPDTQKQISSWIKQLGWDFPINSVKTIFNKHIFNYLYIWKDEQNNVIAYSICYFSKDISHIAYVFYHPDYSHGNLPIRLVLQTIIDSYDLKLDYCYLGRFSPQNGYYKRNMPGFEHFYNHQWLKYDKSTFI